MKTWTSYSDAVSFKTLPGSTITANSSQQQQPALIAKSIGDGMIKLSPNPTNGAFMLELHLSANNKYTGEAKVEVINMLGVVVHAERVGMSSSVLQKNINMSSSLPSGMYMVRVTVNGQMYLAKLMYVK